MIRDQRTYELIEAYLLGDLSEVELKAFEERMINEPAFKKTVEEEELLHFTTNSFATSQLSFEVNGHFSQRKKRDRTKRMGLIIGGSVLIGLLVLFLLYLIRETPTPQPELHIKKTSTSPTVEPSKPKGISTPSGSSYSTIPVAKTLEPTLLDSASTSTKTVAIDSTIPIKTDYATTSQTTSPKAQPISSPTPHPESEELTMVETNFELKITHTASCRDSPSGAISIIAMGGKPPFRYYIDDQLYETSTVAELPSGYYKVSALDAFNTPSEVTMDYFISEVTCFTPQKAFNPDYESWNYQYGEHCELEIKSKLGETVFFDSGEDFQWTGTNQNGNRVPLGEYLYLVKYQGEIVRKGFVSVIY